MRTTADLEPDQQTRHNATLSRMSWGMCPDRPSSVGSAPFQPSPASVSEPDPSPESTLMRQEYSNQILQNVEETVGRTMDALTGSMAEAMDRSTELISQRAEEAVRREAERIQHSLQMEQEIVPEYALGSVRKGLGAPKRAHSLHRTGSRQRHYGSVDYSGSQSENDCREYDHQVTVELKATFLKINDIDTLSQQFEAEIFVQAKWEEIALVGMKEKELERLMPGDLWDPHLTVVNLAGDFDQDRRSYVVRYEEGYEAPVVLNRWRFKGLFREPLELQRFPFDVQDLTLQVSTERSVEEIKMKHDTTQLSSVSTRAFLDSHEWAIYKHVECSYRTTSLEYASTSIHPIIIFSCRVRRKVGYFIWNIVFIVFLVMVLSFLTIPVTPTSTDRLADTITLFLTMVAFKLVVKQSLPTISYLTYLDVYVLGSLMYLVLCALENSAMLYLTRFLDKDLVEDYDNFFCMMLAAVLILFHLLFIIHIQVTVLKRHRDMRENDRQYALQATNLMLRSERKETGTKK